MTEAGTASENCAASLDGDSPAALVYSSGTTGASKGAILTHNNFAANAVNLLACWQITAADRFLLALPLFHVHALGNGLHCWILSGCRMRLLERFEHQSAATYSYKDHNLGPHTTYYYGVEASEQGLTSLMSNVVSATTQR